MKLISENLTFKALAFFLAIFVWYLSKESGEPIQMSFFAPVVFKNVPDSFQVSSNPSQVNLVAQTRNRETFNPLEIQAVLDLNNANVGESPYQITDKDIITPVDVNITRIQPSLVNLIIEELIETEVLIEPRFQGKLKKGFVLESIEMDPSSIRLQGSKSKVGPIKRIMTSQIDLNGLDSSLKLNVQLDIPHGDLLIKSKNVENFIAKINITSKPIKKRFENVPIYLRNAVYESIVTPKVFNVFVEGPASILNNIIEGDIYGIIDLSKFEPGSLQVKPNTITPEKITVLQQWPTVSLWVKSESVINKEL